MTGTEQTSAAPEGENGTARPLERLTGILWPASERLQTVTGGPPPPGFQVARSYIAIPSLTSARFLVPAGSRRVAAASLLRYNSLRDRPTRLVRGSIGVFMRLGLGDVAFRDRIDVCVPVAVGEEGMREVLLEEWLRAAAFDGRPIHIACGIGRQGPNHKPLLQVFSPAASPIGYAKVGWNDFTRELVRTEASRLARCAEAAMPGTWTPSPLHLGAWRDLEISVVSPLPGDAHRFRALDEPPIELVRRIGEFGGAWEISRLAGSGYEARLRAALELAEPRIAGPASSLLDRLRLEDPELPIGSWHGDLVPWNIAHVQGGLAVWDWEHGGDGVPVGFDVVHWHFQVGFIRRGLPAPAAAARARELSRSGLAALGVSPAAADAVVSLYLLELLARYERAAAAGAGRNPRLDPALAQVVAGIAARG